MKYCGEDADWIDLTRGQVVSCCERGNEPSGQKNFGNFVTSRETVNFSRIALLHGVITESTTDFLEALFGASEFT
jgi:hypothetical protein